MSKTKLAEIDGFTPVPDRLVKRYGILTAVVFGRMWRYCQMKDGVCRATLERLAGDLHISRRSVIRHIRILVSAGFLEDTTPHLRNCPHSYVDTGKATRQDPWDRPESGVSQSYSTISEIDCAV